MDGRKTKTQATVIIVGGGPVGLLTALSLGRSGISTLVLESHNTILPLTRAMVYMPVVIPVLKKLGLYEAVARTAFLNREGVVWRTVQGESLAHLPLSGSDPDDFGGVLLLGQATMSALILEELKKYACVEVRFGARVVGIEDVAGADVKVMVHDSDAELGADVLMEAKYVLGADGANSSVRRMLCIPFDGFTYQEWKLIGCDVIYDFEKEMGFTPLNFVVDPDDFCVIAYTGQDKDGLPHGSGAPQWRLAYPEPPHLSAAPDEVRKRTNERVKRFMKGTNFEVVRSEPYTMQQRVAAQARKGRVLLAGDALHSNNPMGGLGLTSGILDACCYGNALARVINGGEPDSLLTECSTSRREAWVSATNLLSQTNLKRMYGFDPETTAQRNGFFERLKTDKEFPKAVRGGLNKMMVNDFEKLTLNEEVQATA